MDDFPKKIAVLVLLVAFFGALFLETPLIYKKVQNGGVPALNFLNPPAGGQKQKSSNSKIYSRENQSFVSTDKKDGSYSSPIHVPALDL
ncbi:MAG: hypothetical protein NUV83_03225 [Candidatus Wolfebacteria bacterium]|nr:hypothetical protein [Candidatus Wolfebacteria bacterium]